MPSSVEPLFRPASVAVVGASRDPASIGFRILEALVMNRFQGPVYPVNPRAKVVGSLRAYPSVKDLPETVDLAVIAVPRDAVLGVVDECAQRGVKALVVITAGFAEVGAEGRELQQKLVEKVRAHGMRMVGPNCMGLLNTDPLVQLNASFSPIFPPPGRVAMASQSGALGLAILGLAKQLHLGLSMFVSVGNKADVSGNDLLEFWENDPNTDVILLYLESFGNPRRFARIARRIGRRKPIVVVKGERTTVGQRAAGSHTAALAASDAAVDALFRQTGVIRADTLEDMFDLAAVLATQPLPPGRRVAIVTNAGGPGILCADACSAGGLEVPELSEAARKILAALLPAAASVRNPIDMIASAGPDHYRRVVEATLQSPEVDALVVIYIPVVLADLKPIVEAISHGITAARAGGGRGKPVLACLMGDVTSAPLILGEEKIPSYIFPEAAGRVLARVAEYAAWRRQPEGAVPAIPGLDVEQARRICRKSGWLTPDDCRAVLEAFGLPVAPGAVAKSPDQAVELARRFGFPAAIKLASTSILHKTEVGGVRLHLADEAAVRRAFDDIRNRLGSRVNEMDGVLVQPMLSGGVELMVGMASDPLFGPLIAFGLGGIHVEILGDVRFGISPLTDQDAGRMIRDIRGFRLLEGYRGHPPADVAALEQVLLRVSRLVEDVPEIREMDLNPIFALPPGQGCRIADARIRVQAEASR
jgi:acetyl coenzyme A synthetase (ADP forming)-like protein